jgi:tight adherence protein C
VILLVAGPVAVLLAASVVGLGHAIRPARAARRRRSAIDAALPDTLELLVHAVRAGLTPHDAIRQLVTVGPPSVAPAFAAVVHRTERGQTLPDALQALPELLGPPAAGAADALAAGLRYGLPLAPLLDQLGIEAREARRRRADAAARRLPVRMSFPLVVCTLPSFVLLAIAPAVIAALSSLAGPAW